VRHKVPSINEQVGSKVSIHDDIGMRWVCEVNVNIMRNGYSARQIKANCLL